MPTPQNGQSSKKAPYIGSPPNRIPLLLEGGRSPLSMRFRNSGKLTCKCGIGELSYGICALPGDAQPPPEHKKAPS